MLERAGVSVASMASSLDSTASFDEREHEDSPDSVPRLPLRREESKALARARRKEQPQTSTPVKWLSSAINHPLISTLGAVLTIVLPPRITSHLTSYASQLNLVDDQEPPLPNAPPTGEQSPWDDGFGFYVAITPVDGATTESPPAILPPSCDINFKTHGGSTPPLVRAPPLDGLACEGETTVDNEG